jgi:hypothetical protein
LSPTAESLLAARLDRRATWAISRSAEKPDCALRAPLWADTFRSIAMTKDHCVADCGRRRNVTVAPRAEIGRRSASGGTAVSPRKVRLRNERTFEPRRSPVSRVFAVVLLGELRRHSLLAPNFPARAARVLAETAIALIELAIEEQVHHSDHLLRVLLGAAEMGDLIPRRFKRALSGGPSTTE